MTVRRSKKSTLRKWLVKFCIALLQFKKSTNSMKAVTTQKQMVTDSNGLILSSNLSSEGYKVVPQTASEIIVVERVHKFSYYLKSETIFWDITENSIKDDENALYTELETTGDNLKDTCINNDPISPSQVLSDDSISILSSAVEDNLSTNSSPCIDICKEVEHIGKG
ncbi:hypothetical protein G9P44_005831 [Scheffersomyces stipitis]|nr:hypothetical protein G9P44_005831 [Scheffersomyces stipitis]